MTKRERWILAASAAALGLTAIPWAFPLVWKNVVAPPRVSAAARGKILADQLGCFSCHGPGGTGHVADAGSDDPVPGFTGGMPWKFAADRTELANWILHGDPKGRGAIQRTAGKHDEATPAPGAHVDAPGTHGESAVATPSGGHAIAVPAEKHEHAGTLKMPAFRNHVTSAQVDDLVAYIVALSPKEPSSDESARRGFEVASKSGCFACHGAMGTGGISNPGSFKGYIPGFTGTDLRELAKDPAEVEAWIREGNVTRLARNPAAKFFLDRQPIKMPAFGKYLTNAEVADLVAMVEWIHRTEEQEE